MDNGKVSVKLKDTQMQELYRMYDLLLKRFVIASPHHLLLKGHVKELRDKLRKKLDVCKKKYTLTMEGTELLAFVQLWEHSGRAVSSVITLTNFEGVMIQYFFDELDKMNKQRRVFAAMESEGEYALMRTN